MSGTILVLNCGSSSIKFAVFDAAGSSPPRTPLWSGKVEGIGSIQSHYSDTFQRSVALELDTAQPYHTALAHIRDRVAQGPGGERLCVTAHRVVHGGNKYFEPVRVDAAVLADLKTYIPLAPLHQPFALDAIEVQLQEHPGQLQIACFDTAFHRTLPLTEQLLPLSWAAWQRGLRRYGFHGLSYEYLSIALPERHGDAARGRCIAAHLGSGASLCAMRNLESIATTMGFSALDGLMMGTRCGALDPGALIYLMESEKLTLEQLGHALYHGSGLLGLSGVSSDPNVLLAQEAREDETGERIRAALSLYVHRIVREIGALVAVLGGLDMLAFTAGIGEHNAAIRERVCRRLAYLGIDIDATANARGDRIISSPASRVRVVVEPTNEEWIAASHAAELILAPEQSAPSVARRDST